jgi:hypothetical protein
MAAPHLAESSQSNDISTEPRWGYGLDRFLARESQPSVGFDPKRAFVRRTLEDIVYEKLYDTLTVDDDPSKLFVLHMWGKNLALHCNLLLQAQQNAVCAVEAIQSLQQQITKRATPISPMFYFLDIWKQRAVHIFQITREQDSQWDEVRIRGPTEGLYLKERQQRDGRNVAPVEVMQSALLGSVDLTNKEAAVRAACQSVLLPVIMYHAKSVPLMLAKYDVHQEDDDCTAWCKHVIPTLHVKWVPADSAWVLDWDKLLAKLADFL